MIMALYQGKRKTTEGEGSEGVRAASRMREEEYNAASSSYSWIKLQQLQHGMIMPKQETVAAATLPSSSPSPANYQHRIMQLPPSDPHLPHLQQHVLVDNVPSGGIHSNIASLSSSGRNSKVFCDQAGIQALPTPSGGGSREIQGSGAGGMVENEDPYLSYLLLSKNGYQLQQNGGVVVQDQKQMLPANVWFSPPAARGPNPSEPPLPPLPAFTPSTSASEMADHFSVSSLMPCVNGYRDLAKEQEQAQANGFMQPRMISHSVMPLSSNAHAMRTPAMPVQATTTMADMAKAPNSHLCNGAVENISHGTKQANVGVAPLISKSSVRTFIKVYKRGSIGRALDVRRFSNYTELKCELSRLFGLDVQLDQKSGWQVVFADDQDELLLMGDDPWEEFVRTVRRIQVLSPSEVAYYMNWDERTAIAPYSSVNTTVTKRL